MNDDEYKIKLDNVSCKFIKMYFCDYMISNGRYEEFIELNNKNYDKVKRKGLYKLFETLDIPKIPPLYFNLPDFHKKKK